MPATFTFDCVSGSVSVTRMGVEYDLKVQNASGATVATLRVSHAKLVQLVDDADHELSRP